MRIVRSARNHITEVGVPLLFQEFAASEVVSLSQFDKLLVVVAIDYLGVTLDNDVHAIGIWLDLLLGLSVLLQSINRVLDYFFGAICNLNIVLVELPHKLSAFLQFLRMR